MEDYPKPREKQRKGNYPYIYKTMKDYVYEDTGWELEQEFDSEWLKITKDGVIRVKANREGYAWNGCTPKWSLFNLFVIGVPDGHIDYRTMEPFTYRASLVHDALYQIPRHCPYPQEKDRPSVFENAWRL